MTLRILIVGSKVIRRKSVVEKAISAEIQVQSFLQQHYSVEEKISECCWLP